MRARANLNPNMLEGYVRASLDRLEFKYRTHAGQFVVEFEVTSPCQMLVRVEDLTRERVRIPFFTRTKMESAVELRRVIGSEGSEGEVKKCAELFARNLRDALPIEPWRGMGTFRTREEKGKWQRLAEL